MTQSPAGWRIIQDASDDETYAILARDPVWNCFALADLEPPMRAYSQFAVAYQEENKECAICLVLRHPIIGDVLSPFGSAEGVAAILQHTALPERPLIQVQEAHVSALQQYYQPETTWRSMLRMAATGDSLRTPSFKPARQVRELTGADLPALEQFYARQSEIPFSAELFPQGLYFGAYEEEQIIAAGGTHTLTLGHRIAVLGHILTAPEARRQGYATAIAAALAITLFQRDISTVVLNVFADNSAAIRVYERLGFQTRHRLVTGRAVYNASSGGSVWMTTEPRPG